MLGFVRFVTTPKVLIDDNWLLKRHQLFQKQGGGYEAGFDTIIQLDMYGSHPKMARHPQRTSTLAGYVSKTKKIAG